MDAEQLARETGLSLDEAEEILRDSQPPESPPVPVGGNSTDDDDDVTFLQACFPHIPQPVIKAKLAESENVEQASDLLLNYDTIKEIKPVYVDKKLIRQAKQTAKHNQKQKAKQKRHEKDLQVLESMLPTVDKADLKAAYYANGQNLDLTVTACTVKNSTAYAPHVQSIINGLEKPSVGAVPAPARGTSPSLTPILSNSPAEERERVQDALNATLEQLEGYRRNKSMPKQFISEVQARASTLKARLIQLDSIVADSQQAGANKSVVDFHNMTVSGAVAVCEQRLGAWLDDLSKRHLYLITGAGRHSARGVPLIKGAVGKYLRQVNANRYLIQEEEGAFFLTKTLK